MKPTLGKRAVANILKIARQRTLSYREELNKNIHIAEITYEAISASVPLLSVKEHSTLLDIFKRASSHTSTSLSNAVKKTKGQEWLGLVYVEDKIFGQFLLAQSYNTLQQYVSDAVKSIDSAQLNRNILAPIIGKDRLGRTQVRIGHIASSFSQGTTPLLEKLRDVQRRLPLKASNKVFQYISQLQNYHTFDVEYVFDRSNIASSGKTIGQILGRGVVLVTLQSDAKNAALAKLEAEITREVVKYLKSAEFASDVVIEPGSNTIVQDIVHNFLQVFNPKLGAPPKHRKKPPDTGKGQVPGGKKILSKPIQLPALRNLRGQFFSLASLQQLLDATLAQVIKQNMGNGSRKDILNLRSGRFAESAKVERLSQSREGMITAFYSYMKNPYQTFEPGFRQGSPASRNPKLLISKSIREIAATQVANRMRAVSV